MKNFKSVCVKDQGQIAAVYLTVTEPVRSRYGQGVIRVPYPKEWGNAGDIVLDCNTYIVGHQLTKAQSIQLYKALLVAGVAPYTISP